jgi:lipopolysaccharide transport system ATP-binding protein
MSSKICAIRCEGIGKRYLVPRRQTGGGALGQLRDHLKEFTALAGRNEGDYFWALRDVSFDVNPGEVMGIVGRNGSGKSTLLKILSGVTVPSEGRAELRGRIGSLLEVGTGFNPDMTGRENVFMGGALLGLSQAEIHAKLDEIIDFSGIGQFIDVPVKRYSSGMYVRLAYSVASLLRSDILILDEVLAVGDAGFREKSEKNISRLAKDGRTVLLVSHSMSAIRHMCDRAIVLQDGRLVADGLADDAVRDYLHLLHDGPSAAAVRTLPARVDLADRTDENWPRSFKTIKWIETATAGRATRVFRTGDQLIVRIGYEMPQPVETCYFSLIVTNDVGERMFVCYSYHDNDRVSFPQAGVIECRIDKLLLLDGNYDLSVDFGRVAGELRFLDYLHNATEIVVEQGGYLGKRPNVRNQGIIAQRTTWAVAAPVATG